MKGERPKNILFKQRNEYVEKPNAKFSDFQLGFLKLLSVQYLSVFVNNEVGKKNKVNIKQMKNVNKVGLMKYIYRTY